MGKIPIISPKVDKSDKKPCLCTAFSFNHGNHSKMNNRDKELLKSILSIPTRYKQEQQVIDFLVEWCESKRYSYEVDDIGNVLVTKGQVNENQYYPLICSHIDGVHPFENKTIIEDKKNEILYAVNEEGLPVGCSGDDLCGTYCCLKLLDILDCVKVGFYVSEEIGFIGSSHSLTTKRNWYNDIGYVIEFDSPGDRQVTEVCNGQRLFDRDREYFNLVDPILQLFIPDKPYYIEHPYTDVYILRKELGVASINLPTGYYNYHSKTEYVKIQDVQRAVNIGLMMIQKLGHKKY